TFIPNAVYTDGTEKKFVNLTDPNYDHRYFVDGSASVSDAFDGSVWQSYLLFGLGRGGKSVSAINVTDTTYTASDIQWEFSNAELGYTYGTPVVARFADNKWYAIFPNGLDSTSQKASVFVVNINNAADYHILTTGVGSVATPNGMMAIQPKLSADRTVTDIYAGDIRGNVWKFDVYNEGTSSVQWNNGVKLFTTGNASTGTPQSITGGLRVGKHPGGLGSIIYFGTGKYFEVGDNSYSGSSVPQVDTFYAVLDNGTTTNLTRSQLKPQTFTMVGNNRTASQNSVSYSGSEMGWYIDLLDGTTKRGERVNSTPLLSGGRVIFASIIPAAGASCGGEGSSYLNELDALTGGMLNDKVLDTNNDGKIDSSDTQVASVQLNGLISDPSIVGGQDRDYKIIGSTSAGGSVQILSETKTGSGDDNGIPRGRVSWQQLQ
ncbi:MAG TPA: PilC/PilY family type IV pilus protein, partial [Pseudomonadales bacterium]|nr:PilC/PilY family type IV pilus protein [Pseudomonadales bacterium]